MLQHACLSECLAAVCVHLGTRQIGISISQCTVLGEARLIVHLIKMYRRWGLAKNHLAGQVFKVRLHGEWQPKCLSEECLSGNLQPQIAFANMCLMALKVHATLALDESRTAL